MTSPTSSMSTSSVGLATSQNINALISGDKWGGGTGTGVTLTYSFPWTSFGSATFSGPNGFGDYSMLNEQNASFHYGLNTMQQVAVRSALQSWANVANIMFTEVSETSSNVGDIRFAWTSAAYSDAWGWANYPNSYWPSGGDIWISTLTSDTATNSWTAGTYNFNSLIHELGHALGLKHPFDGTAVLPSSLDNSLLTVMSYTNAPNDVYPSAGYINGNYDWLSYFVIPQTPMVLDVAAIQYLYGANTQYHTGNDTYTFDDTKPFFETIWDAGGIDTISAGNYTLSCLIDLTPGHYSSLKILPPVNTGGATTTYDGTNALGLAYGCIIENAIGGSGDDTLIGNSSNNQLIGGPGSDTVVFTGRYNEYAIIYNPTSSYFTVTDSKTGRDGSDDIFGAEFFSFSDTTLTSSQLNNFDITGPIISSFSPMDGAMDISTTSDIVLTFNESIQRGTGNIVLKTVEGTLVETFDAASSIHLSISGSTLTINPASILADSTHYSLSFTSATIKDLAGNGYAGTTTYDFTTAAESDAPVTLTFSPSDKATGVTTTANILVTLNETIQRGTGNIVIKTAAGTTVESFDAATSSHLSISGNTLTIDPTSTLANGTKYFVTFEAGTIKDLAGNSYAGTTAYDFFTATSEQAGLEGFDKAYYLNVKLDALQEDPGTAWSWTNKDTAYLESVLTGAGFTAESHYIAYGYQEGLAPNAFFNPTEYKLAKATYMFNYGGYGSIAAAEEVLESAWPYDIYQHYLQYGSKEGINPSNSFDESSYYDSKLASLQSDPLAAWTGKTSSDLKALFDSLNLTPLQHYLMYGANEGIAVTSVPPGERVGSAAIANSMGIDQAEINLVGVVVSSDPDLGWSAWTLS